MTDVDLAVRLVSVITNVRKEQLVTGNLSPEACGLRAPPDDQRHELVR